jgi:hypothetical protein
VALPRPRPSSELERKVVAFMSDNHIDPDIAAEIFVLAPAGVSA